MSDLLRDIFTDEILARLRKSAPNSPAAAFRYLVLSSQHQPEFDLQDSTASGGINSETRSRWNRWVAAAIAAGLFNEPYGIELHSRLTGIDDDGFRSALAECMTCWTFSCELGLRLLPRPSGRDGCVLEFAVQANEGRINIEVKSPRLHRLGAFGQQPEEPATLDNFSAMFAMRSALRCANRQFLRARRNVLVIALPDTHEKLGASLCKNWRELLFRAFYGEHRLITHASGVHGNEFVAEGNFLKRPGGMARFTRISAVIGLQDSWACSNLQAAVLHNPCSQEPLHPSIFRRWPQFEAVDGGIRCFYSDAHAEAMASSS